jgi:predicted Zn-dependent protease
MKYTAKELKGNVNISKTSPLKEFSILLGGSLAGLVIIYIFLGFVVDIIAPRLSPEIEQKLGNLYRPIFKNAEHSNAADELQRLLQNLLDKSDWHDVPFKAHLVKTEKVNAIALPGNNIVVYSGLINELASENALSFVLAHELGHYANRDHIKGLGRALILVVLSSTLLGADNPVTNFLSNSLYNTELKFSQKKETKADLWALDLMDRHYGHVAGATQFFKTLGKKEGRGKLAYYFASHPHPDIRVEFIEKEIKSRKYRIGHTISLNDVFKD